MFFFYARDMDKRNLFLNLFGVYGIVMGGVQKIKTQQTSKNETNKDLYVIESLDVESLQNWLEWNIMCDDCGLGK